MWRVLDYQHIKMARGGATIRLKVRNLRSGATIEKTYNSGARVDDIRLDSRAVEYLYTDGDLYHFMDTDTFDQVALSRDALESVVPFLKDNTVVELESFEGEPIDVSLPTTVDLEGRVGGDGGCRRYGQQALPKRSSWRPVFACTCRCL